MSEEDRRSRRLSRLAPEEIEERPRPACTSPETHRWGDWSPSSGGQVRFCRRDNCAAVERR